MLTYDTKSIARATNSNVSVVKEALNCLMPTFALYGLDDIRAIAGALATIAVECNYRCEREQGPINQFNHYNNRADLGNVGQYAMSGYIYRGAGYIQLTGAYNYKKYGDLIGVDLLQQPELANEPFNAARIFVLYYMDHGCDFWAIRGNWRKVRQSINGGLNNFGLFQIYVYNLLELLHGQRGEWDMSLIKMILAPIIKEIKNNVRIQAALTALETAEVRVMPILLKIDQKALAFEIAALSGGRITAIEVETIETEIGNTLRALESLATELEAATK